ncbi:hypothetical protein JMA_05150 [Jeotgalibacillus malaysiensis]|uniref:Uncharacterized protein n=1 Tax=Jeotgalibacillus malaysiensis TaxID=1508404 RepID=A0A0B5AMF6_9BACL|nr:hypothetical protein JMA_05150 [Jeotgalibacillus malaysiensis]
MIEQGGMRVNTSSFAIYLSAFILFHSPLAVIQPEVQSAR